MAGSLPRRLIVAGSVLIALTLGAAAEARANTFTIKPCSVNAAMFQWGKLAGITDWSIQDECGTGARLYIRSSSNATNSQSWWYPKDPRSGLQIISASAILKGNDGNAVGKQRGISMGDGPIHPRPGVNYTTSTQVNWGSTPGKEPIDPGASTINLHGKCVTDPPCEADADLMIANLDVIYDDLTPPTVASPAIVPVTKTQPYVPELEGDVWINSKRRVTWSAEDAGSGVIFGLLKHTSSDFFDEFNLGCGWVAGRLNIVSSGFCPTSRGWEYYVDPGDGSWGDGPNALTFSARDMALNESSTTVDFKVDTTAPDAPVGITVDDVMRDGWRSTNNFRVTWYNPTESFEDEYQSGVHAVGWELSPAGNEPGSSEGFVEEPGIWELNLQVPGDGVWNLRLWTWDKAGNKSLMSESQLKYEHLVFDAPTLEPVDWINRAELLAGVPLRWRKPDNWTDSQAGICGYGFAVDTPDPEALGSVLDFYGDVSETLFRQMLEDGRHHAYLRAVSCAGVRGEISQIPIDVDTTRPVVNLEPDDGEWLAGKQVPRLQAQDDGSGVSEIAYRVDGGSERVVSGSSVALRLPLGRHSVEYHAVDEAGNRSPTRTSELLLDDAGPTGSIAPFDPAQPALVRATVADPESGIASAWLEYEAVDGGIGGSPQISRTVTPATGTKRLDLAGRLPAASMPSGAYRLKVVAKDHAGNESVTTTRVDGSDALVTAPLLETPVLTTGFRSAATRACSRNRRSRACRKAKSGDELLASRQFVEFGHGSVLAGSLAHENGDPLAGAQLRVLATVAYSNAVEPIGEAVTGADGRYSFKVPSGPTRQLELRFAGTETALPVAARATLLTHGKATLSISPKVVNEGRQFVLSGKVLSAASGLPQAGKNVVIEFRSREGWRPFGLDTQTGDDGSFRVERRLRGLSKPVRMRLRARLRNESGWPFATGHSRTVTLVVRNR